MNSDDWTRIEAELKGVLPRRADLAPSDDTDFVLDQIKSALRDDNESPAASSVAEGRSRMRTASTLEP